MSEPISFRFALPEDCPRILKFIRGLAEYEHLSHEVVATESLLREWLFEKKKAEVLFACLDGQPVGKPRQVVLMMHKPAGYVTATQDASATAIFTSKPAPSQKRKPSTSPTENPNSKEKKSQPSAPFWTFSNPANSSMSKSRKTTNGSSPPCSGKSMPPESPTNRSS